MRKLLLAAAATAALSVTTAANAAITVTAASNLNSPNPLTDPTAVKTVGSSTTIDFGINPVAMGAFTGSLDFTNTMSGLYSILLGSSTPGVTFSSASLVGIGGTPGTFTLTGNGTNLEQLAQTMLGSGSYRFSFAGNNPNASGVVSGNVTILQGSVPEPATWALMVLGFGAVGMSIRRRRRQGLSQIA